MELREYYAMVRKWWWLLLLCTILAGGVSYLVSRQIAPTYEASTLVMIGSSLDVLNPTTGEIQTSEKLAQTYAELLKTRPILDAVVAALNLPAHPRLSVSLIRNTQLMRITVADTLPDRAAATANELAQQLILQSPSAPQRQEQAYREFVQRQLSELEREIAALSEAILSQKSNGNAEEVARLEGELNLRRANYSTLLTYIKDSSINYIRVIEPAQPPENPTKPRVYQNTLLAALVGLLLAAGGVFLIEYLDDSVKGQAEVEQVLGLPTLGVIAHISSLNGDHPEQTAVNHPKSPYAEAYRMLRTNLRYSLSSDKRKRTFLLTSTGPGEGKSTTISNLSIVTAQAGQRTILVDADMRRPTLHKHFDVPNQVGLSSLLVGEANQIEEALQPTEVENLSILPSGPIPPNAAELLDSPRMIELLDQLAERADVVLVDSPPVLAVTDASILASLVSGIVLVLEAGRTRRDACQQSVEAIRKVGGNLLGVVLNRLDLRRNGYYYRNHYHYYYYPHSYGDTDDQDDGHRNGRGNGNGSGSGNGDSNGSHRREISHAISPLDVQEAHRARQRQAH